MPLLVANALHKAYGPRVLLESVDVSVHPGDRIGIVGVNGAGKSTLCKILAGALEPDSGTVARRGGINVSYLAQEPDLPEGKTAREVVRLGLGPWSDAMARYEAITDRVAGGEVDEQTLAEQAEAAAEIERLGGWDHGHHVDAMLGHLNVQEPDAVVDRMSGGERRRVALARLLVQAPELAILDEPTNHLDVDTIEWLERYLIETYPGALILITHDRYVLDRVVNKTLEVAGGEVYTYDGGWEEYLVAKSERQAQEARAERNRQNLLRTELEWLRRSPSARRTKSRSRVQRAEALRDQSGPEQERGSVFTMQTTRQGKTIVELRDLSVSLGGRTLIDDLTFSFTKGMRVGVVGPNGAGKSTLLRLLVDELQPDAGEVHFGKNTEVAYFDQSRSGLDDTRSLMENVSGSDTKAYFRGGQQDVRSYLARFQFGPERMKQKVSALSGGERARVALAKLLLRPANLFLFDEPTNDLDTTTLRSLEQMLVEADATAVVVSHDRYFLDRVATHILAFEGDGRIVPFVGGYTMYRTLRDQSRADEKREAKQSVDKQAPAAPAADAKPRKLSYKERQELDRTFEAIEVAETRLAELETLLGDPALYTDRKDEVQGLVTEQASLTEKVEQLMARWEELEAIREAAEG